MLMGSLNAAERSSGNRIISIRKLRRLCGYPLRGSPQVQVHQVPQISTRVWETMMMGSLAERSSGLSTDDRNLSARLANASSRDASSLCGSEGFQG